MSHDAGRVGVPLSPKQAAKQERAVSEASKLTIPQVTSHDDTIAEGQMIDHRVQCSISCYSLCTADRLSISQSHCNLTYIPINTCSAIATPDTQKRIPSMLPLLSLFTPELGVALLCMLAPAVGLVAVVEVRMGVTVVTVVMLT